MEKISGIHRLSKTVVLENLDATLGVCFNLTQTMDASPKKAGDLFKQDEDFIMVETIIDDVMKTGPGIYTPNRVIGGIEITLHTKNSLNPDDYQSKLEDIGMWFAQKTIEGVRFREFVPTGDGRDGGFNTFSSSIAFQFETPAQGA